MIMLRVILHCPDERVSGRPLTEQRFAFSSDSRESPLHSQTVYPMSENQWWKKRRMSSEPGLEKVAEE